MLKNNNTHRLTLLSFFTALIMIQTFVPWLGYIPLGFAHITIVHVTVILASMLLGRKDGALLGLIWGVLAIIRNLIQPNILSPVFINPLVALPGRLLVGYLIGLLSSQLKAHTHYDALLGAFGSIINTVTTMGLAYIFAKEALFQAMNISHLGLFQLILTIMLPNGIFEALVSALLTRLICPLLRKSLNIKH